MFNHEAYWKTERKKYCSPTSELAFLFVDSKIKYMQRYINFDEDTSILEVGAGTGIFMYHFSKLSKKVIGVDLSEQLLKQSSCCKTLICGDAFSLPFKNKTFDLAFSSCLLHHVNNPELAVRELARVSKKYVILCEPNRNNPAMFIFNAIFRHERGGLKFSKNYVKKILYQNSLKILSLDTMGFVTPNSMPLFIARLLRPFDKCNKIGFYIMAIGELKNDN